MKPATRPAAVGTLLFDPYCRDAHHAQFNAALAHTAGLAFPGEPLTAHGQADHLACMAEAWRAAHPDGPGLPWRPEPAGPVSGPGWLPGPRQLVGYRRLLRRCDRERLRLVVATCRETDLWCLAVLGRLHPRTRIVAVLHGRIGSVLERQPRSPIRRAMAFRQLLRMPTPPDLRLAVLSPGALAAVSKLVRRRGGIGGLDVPTLWCDGPAPDGPPGGPRPTFTLVSVASEPDAPGVESFRRAAAALAPGGVGAFRVVGRVPRRVARRLADSGVDCEPGRWMAPAEYAEALRRSTYVVCGGSPGYYALGASAGSVDAVGFTRPLISLRTRFHLDLFDACGDVGYLCDDADALAAQVTELAVRPDPVRYRTQRRNLARSRERFSPVRCASQFRRIAG